MYPAGNRRHIVSNRKKTTFTSVMFVHAIFILFLHQSINMLIMGRNIEQSIMGEISHFIEFPEVFSGQLGDTVFWVGPGGFLWVLGRPRWFSLSPGSALVVSSECRVSPDGFLCVLGRPRWFPLSPGSALVVSSVCRVGPEVYSVIQAASGESLHDAEEQQYFHSKSLLDHWAAHTLLSESS